MTASHRKGLLVTAIAAAIALVAPAAGTAQTTGDPVPTWSPASIGFGKTKVRKSSEIRRVDVQPGSGCGAGWMPPMPCTLSYGFLDVAVSGPFAIVDTTCRFGENLSPCFVDVRFRPRSRGRHDGFLRITPAKPAQDTPGPPTQPEAARGVPLTGKGCHKVRGNLRCKSKT